MYAYFYFLVSIASKADLHPYPQMKLSTLPWSEISQSSSTQRGVGQDCSSTFLFVANVCRGRRGEILNLPTGSVLLVQGLRLDLELCL